MIERKILYYPSIIIPDEWLKNAVLYWDTVSAIEPMSFEPRRVHGDIMEKWFSDRSYLIDEGIFESSYPRRVFYGRQKKSFTQEFFKIIEKENILSTGEWSQQSVMEVYDEKFSPQIVDFLLKKKLAIRNESNTHFLERKASLIYLALMAKYLADTDGDSTTTNTDLPDYESIAYRPIEYNQGFNSYSMLLSNILPTPRQDVTLKKVVNFKKDYGENVNQLRKYIREVQKEVIKGKTQTEVKEILVNSKEHLEMEITRLKKELDKSGIETFFSSINSMLQVKIPEIINTIGISIATIPINLKAAGAITLGGIAVGSVLMQKHYEREELKDDSPATYLYYAQKKGIID